MKRELAAAQLKKGEWLCPDKSWLKAYPTLAAGMCDCWWDDGKPRLVWSLTVRFEAGSCHLCVNDKEKNAGLYTTGEDFLDALALLEGALKEGVATWRRWRK